MNEGWTLEVEQEEGAVVTWDKTIMMHLIKKAEAMWFGGRSFQERQNLFFFFFSLMGTTHPFRHCILPDIFTLSRRRKRWREGNSWLMIFVCSSFCFFQVCHGNDWKAAPCCSSTFSGSVRANLLIHMKGKGASRLLVFQAKHWIFQDSKSPFLEGRKTGFLSI